MDSEKKLRGIHAINRDYLAYEQLNKNQSYHLAETEGSEKFDEDFEIRSVDVGRFLHGGSRDRERFAVELGAAMREIGFVILEGHGIEASVHQDALDGCQEFFESTPLDVKLQFRAQRQGSVNQGYFPIEETSDIHPDQVEGWVFCRRAFDLAENQGAGKWGRFEHLWPDPAREPTFRRLVEANETLVLPIMQSILRSLGCDPHLYDRKLSRPSIGLRLNYYPALRPERATSGAGRLLGHEDVGMFTLLPAPRVEGLQALNRRTMKWVRIAAPPGSIVLNTGDYIQRISNDLLPSTTHRVSRPRDPSRWDEVRLSIPMNVYVWENEMLEVLPGLADPRYPPIRAIEFHTRITSKFYGDDYAVTE